MKVRGHVFVC